jgi:hypothetical protein
VQAGLWGQVEKGEASVLELVKKAAAIIEKQSGAVAATATRVTGDQPQGSEAVTTVTGNTSQRQPKRVAVPVKVGLDVVTANEQYDDCVWMTDCVFGWCPLT